MVTVDEIITLLKKFPGDKPVRIDLPDGDFYRLSNETSYDNEEDEVVIRAYD